jgi:hypothetical protein
MTNINSAPFQQDFSNANSAIASNDQAISDNAQTTQESDSNKLWLALLIILAIIVGFWIGFFVNEYFYQSPEDQNAQIDVIDDLTPEPIVERAIEVDRTEEIDGTGEEYIVFREENYNIGETISIAPDNECISEDLNLILTDIQEDKLVFEVEALVLDRSINQFVEEMIEIEIEDQYCSPALTSCENTPLDYCFSVNSVDGIYNLGYELREGTLTPLN